MSATKETTVPKTVDDLLEEAAAAQARAAEIHAGINAAELKKHEARLEAQRRFDEHFVAGFTRAALDADLAQARAHLDDALARDPLVNALADWQSALRRRAHALQEHMAALGRLGRPTAPVDTGVTELIGSLDEYVLLAARRITDDRIATETATFQARRDAAGTEETR